MHLQNSNAFVRVDFYSPMCNHKAEELASADPESAFFRVEEHVVFSDFSEYFFQVYNMLGYAMVFDDYVVDLKPRHFVQSVV